MGIPFLFIHKLTLLIMDKNKLREIAKMCSNNSILVINDRGIFRLFTPFKVVCVIAVESISKGQEVVVISVKMSLNYKIVYLIKDKAYYHTYFIIISKPTAIQTTFS